MKYQKCWFTIKYPIWFTCSLRSFRHLNVTGPFWVFLMEKWHLNIIRNFPTKFRTKIGKSRKLPGRSASTPISNFLKFKQTASEKFENLYILLSSLRSKYGMTSPTCCCGKWSGRWGKSNFWFQKIGTICSNGS